MKVGMIGSGMIANVFLNTFQSKSNLEVTGIWCMENTLEMTKELADKYHVDLVETDIDAFLKSELFDVAYIALINSVHYEYARKALLAGKHVIVEKPFTTTYEQAKELASIAKEKNLMLFDCAMSKYSENIEALKKAVQEIGEIKIINFAYSQYSRRYDAYLEGKVLPVFSRELAGGALYDLNVYCLSLIDEIFGEPEEYKYYPNIGYNGIDVSGVMVMDYGSYKAVSYTAKDCDGFRGGYIQGSKGYIRIDGMPANLQNMFLVMNGQSEKKIDVVKHDDPREYMFRKIDEIVEEKDYKRAAVLIEKPLETMKIMECARKEAGIYFPSDPEYAE